MRSIFQSARLSPLYKVLLRYCEEGKRDRSCVTVFFFPREVAWNSRASTVVRCPVLYFADRKWGQRGQWWSRPESASTDFGAGWCSFESSSNLNMSQGDTSLASLTKSLRPEPAFFIDATHSGSLSNSFARSDFFFFFANAETNSASSDHAEECVTGEEAGPTGRVEIRQQKKTAEQKRCSRLPDLWSVIALK